MNLEELYQETEATEFEVMRSDGKMSGHKIKLKPIFSDDVTLAQMRYNRLFNASLSKFEAENQQLREECETAENFIEYNYLFECSQAPLKSAFALELVDGWDFDNEFTKEALSKALESFDKPFNISLAAQIINAYSEAVNEYAKK